MLKTYLKEISNKGCSQYAVYFQDGFTESICRKIHLEKSTLILTNQLRIVEAEEEIEDFGDLFLEIILSMSEITNVLSKDSKEYILKEIKIDHKNKKIIFGWKFEYDKADFILL